MAVLPGTERWSELVRQGIIIDGQRNWGLGDAALEIAPMGTAPGPSGAYELLDRYAAEVGISRDSLINYRTVAAAWLKPGSPDVSEKSGTRVPDVPWSVHRYLMKFPKLIKPGMTMKQAEAAVEQARGTSAVVMSVIEALEQASTVVETQLIHAGPLPEDLAPVLQQAYNRAVAAVGQLGRYIEQGHNELDDFLASVL